MKAEKNLDLQCAECGRDIAGEGKVSQALVNSALAVLLEQGVYAMFLFLCSRGNKDKKAAKKMRERLYQLLARVLKKDENTSAASAEKEVLLQNVRENFVQDMETAYLTKDIAEQALIYARYHVKAREKNKTAGEQE